MLTGIGETLNEMTSPLYGADAYIDKPFEFSELDHAIEETLRQRRAGAIGRPDAADVMTVTEGRGAEPRFSELAHAVETMSGRLERLETRLKMLEEEQRNEAIDLTKFYRPPEESGGAGAS